MNRLTGRYAPQIPAGAPVRARSARGGTAGTRTRTGRGKRGPTRNGRSSAARFRAAADADRPQVGYSAGGAACRAHSAFGAEVADRTAASDRFTGTTRPRMESADAFAGEGAPAGAACR